MSGVMQFNGILTTGEIVCKKIRTEDVVATKSLSVPDVNIGNLLGVNGYDVVNGGDSLNISKDGELLLSLSK